MSISKPLVGLLLLSSALSFPALVHAQDESSAAAADSALAADDGEENYEEPDISLPGGELVVTGRRTRDVTRSSTQVVNVLSAEDIARTGEGDIAGALGHVTGLSVVGDGRVFVRGLGDRYSLAMLNGLPLPSPEPLSRVVPLDIFPTNIVASSLVQKTYSPNFPGEFGGGVINLTTRAVPEESFLKISASISGDTQTTGSNGLTYFGSDYDWTGFDNGNRDVPSNLQAFWDSGKRISELTNGEQEAIIGQLMPTNLVTLQKIDNLRPNFSGSITGGTAVDVGADARLGIIATASIKNSWRNREVHSQESTPDLSTVTEDFNTFITDMSTLVNGMLGFGLEFGEHQIRWTNVYIRDTLKQAKLGLGTNYTYGSEGFDFATQNTAWYERQLIDTQLVGEFEFDTISLDVRGGFAQTDREAPYNATFPYTRTNLNSQTGDYYTVYLNGLSDTNLPSVSFDDLTEKQWFGGIDLSYQALDNLMFSVGYSYSDTSRYSVRREYSIAASADVLDTSMVSIIGMRPPGDIINGATLAGLEFEFSETSDYPAFDAGLVIHGAYGKVQYLPSYNLTIDLGARYEDAKQTVQLDQSIYNNPITGAIETNNQESYFLPAATITWEATDSLQLRASASKTIARPQFRELVEQLYDDPESNRSYRGNPYLVDSELLNFEARAEYYLGRGDRISLAAFYKKIDNPIEAYVNTSAGSLITSFANAPEATLYGAELDFQYGYDLYDLGGWFMSKKLALSANYTYTNSEISVSEDDRTLISGSGEVDAALYFDDGDPLTGQSDHVGNLSIGLEDLDKLQQFTIMLNYASERVTSRGFQRPDIVENPGLTVDFVARQEVSVLKHPFELKFEARNIFGRDNLEYQENADYRIDINTYDVGTSFSLGVSTEF